ncbi:MAG TPA: hypothetical protein VMT96_00815 [Candidatus Bathyarchaeia archaeon]|nr:hypothetical protein [Candidatus Bathyarchaeia archaeon]
MKIAKSAGAVMTSLGLVVGLSGLAGATAGNIGLTGPLSNNTITSNLNNNANINNNNSLSVDSWNSQTAKTGKAVVANNTFGGSAISGDALNCNYQGVSALFNNNQFGAGSLPGLFLPNNDFASISATGPGSNNVVALNTNNNLNVTNNNNIDVQSSNTQTAKTGKALVTGNTSGGSAISGDATNSNSQAVSIAVGN